MKTRYSMILVFFSISSLVFSGEWDYVPNVSLQYLSNESEEVFGRMPFTDDDLPDDVSRITKIPREVHQAIRAELKSYTLDIGDCFLFTCGYEWTSPKAIAVMLRITSINNDGSYSYVFYAWQFR